VVEFILDTGYSGFLTLPAALIAGLGLIWLSQTSAILANQSVVQVESYAATVVWDGSFRPIIVEAVDAPPLLGTRLLAGHDLRVRMVDGGRAEIEAVP